MPCANPRDTEDDARLVQLRQTVWRLRRAYDNATGGEGGGVLAGVISRLSDGIGSASRGFPLWINLIETLAQDAEQRFGSRPGLGAYKAEQVKAAINYLLSRNPSFLALQFDPALISATIDLTIDFVVMLLNREGLWVGREVAKPEPTWTSRLWRWILKRALVVFEAIHRWLEPPAQLSPAMLASVNKILAVPAADPFILVTKAAEFVSFVSAHRHEVASISEIVSTACSEAEHFTEMSGAEKQAYACDLILVLFEEEYGMRLTGAERDIFSFVAARLTDAVVHIFNKHGVFDHAPAAAP